MLDSISRRDFLKTSSVAGIAAAAINPVSSLAEPSSSSTKSLVVIAKDEKCLNGTTPDAAKIQDMVDNVIMKLTGKTSKGAAYEALFPKAVTESTKIILKRNDLSGMGPDNKTINATVIDCVKKGLTSMLDGKFSATNVTIFNKNASLLSTITSSDYIINCPVCWCHSAYSVTLSLKNTMGYLAAPSSVHSTAKTWLHQNSLDSRIKPKQVLSIMDVIVGNNKNGPSTAKTFTAYSIIASRDLVAVDYNALRFMEAASGANTSYIQTGDSQLKAAEAAGLGTCTPDKMEIIKIQPPWTTGITVESEPLMQSLNVQVLNKNNRIEFIVPSASSHKADVAIFDMMGRLVWHTQNQTSNCITWNNTALSGALVPTGIYAYLIKTGSARLKGIVTISK